VLSGFVRQTKGLYRSPEPTWENAVAAAHSTGDPTAPRRVRRGLRSAWR
jgi:hypothetical protein